jgi:hypothetical protein
MNALFDELDGQTFSSYGEFESRVRELSSSTGRPSRPRTPTARRFSGHASVGSSSSLTTVFAFRRSAWPREERFVEVEELLNQRALHRGISVTVWRGQVGRHGERASI